MIDWRRQWIVRGIQIGLGLLLFVVGEVSGLLTVLAPDGLLALPPIHLFIALLAADLLTNHIRNLIAGQALRWYQRGLRLGIDGALAEAIEAYKEQLAYLERTPWIERLRTPLLFDVYRESLAESLWLHIADFARRLDDREQMLAAYEKVLALNPSNYSALVSMNLLAARSGGEPRPFEVQPQQLALASGAIAALVQFALALLVAVWDTTSVSYPAGWAALRIIFSFYTWPLIGVVVAPGLITYGYSWAANRIIQMGYYRGYQLLRTGHPAEAARALDQDAMYWRRHRDLQQIQRWLLDATPQSYLERTLRLEATAWLKLGRLDNVIRAYRECVVLNPDSNARHYLHLLDLT